MAVEIFRFELLEDALVLHVPGPEDFRPLNFGWHWVLGIGPISNFSQISKCIRYGRSS